MSILEDIRDIQSTPKELRQFGLTVGSVLVLLGSWALWRGRSWGPYGAASGAVLIALGAWAPAVLKPLQRVWMALAVCMGFVMTRVLLTGLFFAVLTPLGIVLRLSGKDVLDRRGTGASAWQDHLESGEGSAFRQY